MDVLSTCPLTVASVTWQPRPNTWVLTVVCKATFALEPVECPLTDAQEAPSTEDVHWHHDPSRSLAAASDLAPLKPRAEVILVGHAYAPQRSPTRSLLARLVVGEIDKTVEVLCDRFVGGDGAVVEQAPFVKMPLVYERAAGGRGTWNPAGLHPDTRDAYGRVVLPNLQPPGAASRSSSEGIARVGFGPIAPDWPMRRDKLGRHAGTWSARSLAREPLPQDIDPGYFNAAPPDQQIPALRGDEGLVLENLHPEHRRVTTRLPGLVPAAVVQIGGGSQPLSMRCDTLWIDTDRARVMLTFRGQLTMERPDAAGRVVVSMRRPRSSSMPPDSETTRTVSPDLLRQREPVLPFEPRVTPTAALRQPAPKLAAPSFGAPPPLPAPPPKVAPPPVPPPSVPPLPVPPPRLQAPSTRSSAPPPPAVEQAPAPRKAEEKAVATEGRAGLEEAPYQNLPVASRPP